MNASGTKTSIQRVTRPPAVSPECFAVLERVGLDFLAATSASYIADPDGMLLWGNSGWMDFVNGLAEVSGGHPMQLPWEIDDIVATAQVLKGAPVCRRDDMATGSGVAVVMSRHWVARAPDGTILGLAGSIDEAAQRGLLQRQTETLRARLEDLTRLMSDWLWETGPDLKLTLVSDRVTTATGLHPRQLVGETFESLGQFIGQTGEAETNPLDRTTFGPFHEVGFVILGADGAPRHFRLSGLPTFEGQSGKFRGYRGTARDVTGETAALGMARTSRRQLSMAIDAVSEGFGLFDAEEHLLLCNQRFLGTLPGEAAPVPLGMTHGEIMARALGSSDVRPGEALDRLSRESLVKRARAGGDIQYKLSDGRWIRATDRVTSDGTIVSIRTDITELKRREHALTEAKLAAESANRAKSEFLANVSHELRTPLNAIIGFSELVLHEVMGPVGAPAYRDYLAEVLKSGHQLLDIINDIIDLAKAEAGRLELSEGPVELGEVVVSARRIVAERARQSGIDLVTHVAPGLPRYLADQRKLRQILLALLSNAIKFTPGGGTVTLELARIEDAGDLRIRITDTGIGMAPSSIENALRPFGQVDSALSRRYDGVGLGLPLSLALVELHGGTLAIESTLDAGTTVTVQLPADRFRR